MKIFYCQINKFNYNYKDTFSGSLCDHWFSRPPDLCLLSDLIRGGTPALSSLARSVSWGQHGHGLHVVPPLPPPHHSPRQRPRAFRSESNVRCKCIIIIFHHRRLGSRTHHKLANPSTINFLRSFGGFRNRYSEGQIIHRISATLVTCDIYLCAGIPFFPAIGDNLKRNSEKVRMH